MASIRKLLENPPTWRETTVDYDGESYVVRARPDARVIGATVYLPEPEAKLKARHWQTLLGEQLEFDVDTVRRALLVHATLQPAAGEPPYDEADVAHLAVTHGLLFLALAGAAMELVGLVGSNPTAEVAAGSDPLSEPPAGSTSSGAA